MRVILSVNNLRKHYPVRQGVFSKVSAHVRAVDDVSFEIAESETLGLVGESGCGKTTVGKTVLRLQKPTAGTIYLDGKNITDLSNETLRPLRSEIQMVFQDPYLSLNPRMTAEQIVSEPLENYRQMTKAERREQVTELFQRVGLSNEQLTKLPHEFSGGQRQRIGIARALALQPKLIVADEPVSALDVSIQAQVINLMLDLQQEFGLAYLFISHDLAVVEHVCHRVAVMYLGKIVEITDKLSLFSTPIHPYTESLLAAVPIPDPTVTRKRIVLEGDVPSPLNPPTGCRFHTRCPYAEEQCKREEPQLTEVRPGHFSACHLRS
ncbi:MAG: dipeptide ABC transporter ATP-binding protein [Gammaproteobacteria bacterium]|nr:dipeptide ABC transporter ATP-binding protein [Gammaproteobacteria bacterium]